MGWQWGVRAVTLGASLQQDIGGVLPVLKWWLYRIFFGQLHILWLHEELYENDTPNPVKDQQNHSNTKSCLVLLAEAGIFLYSLA